MINTILLNKQNDHSASKSFVQYDDSVYLNKKYNVNQYKQFKYDTVVKSFVSNSFRFTSGKVELLFSNHMYWLEHIPGNVDIVLPKVKNLMDWVVFWYDQDQTIEGVSHDTHSKLKIYGNGSRIMGFDETLTCDVPFMALKLVFVNEQDGWIIV